MPTVSVVDGAGLGEIGGWRRGSLLRGPSGELGKDDDRNGEQAGEFLEAAGDQGDVEPALLKLASAGTAGADV